MKKLLFFLLFICCAPATWAADGELYALANPAAAGAAEMELYLLDTSDGSATFLVSTGTSGLRGLAIDPTTGKFYSAYGSPNVTAQRGIVEIDPTTGAVTDIGGTKALVSLTFDSDGQLYATENARQGNGNVYKVDKSNGTEMLLGTVTLQANEFGPGLAFDDVTATLYFKGWKGQVSSVDTASGAESLLGAVALPWYASFAFAFDEDGNVFYPQHPSTGTGFAYADASDIYAPVNLGSTGLRVRGLDYFAPDSVDKKLTSGPDRDGSVSYGDFSDSSGLTLNGSAAQAGSTLRLTTGS